MTYMDISDMATNGDLRQRIAGCAAKEGVVTPHPTSWADQHQWQLAAEPGWADAYAYAVLSGNDRPGRDESVITDGMILSAVQALLNKG